MYLNHIKALYAATVPWHPRGYPQEAIAAVETSMGVTFPAAYRAFHLWNGRNFTPWDGDDADVSMVPDLKDAALEILAEGRHRLTLPADALVIIQHGGYEFNFLRLAEGDDPPVYYYSQTQKEAAFRCLAPHFSVFVADSLTFYLNRHTITSPSSQAFPPDGTQG